MQQNSTGFFSYTLTSKDRNVFWGGVLIAIYFSVQKYMAFPQVQSGRIFKRLMCLLTSLGLQTACNLSISPLLDQKGCLGL